MCIQCHAMRSNTMVFNSLASAHEADFPSYIETRIACIIYSCIGINGEKCQQKAKALLTKYRNWYVNNYTQYRPWFDFNSLVSKNADKIFVFSPNHKTFSELCDKFISYDSEFSKSAEFKIAFLNFRTLEDTELRANIDTLVRTINDGLRVDPNNFKPIISNKILATGIFIGFAMTFMFFY